MGQQQLLLIVLGIVVVSIAVIVGINAFTDGEEKHRFEAEQLRMMELANRAQAWKVTPSVWGGGDAESTNGFADLSLRALAMDATGRDGEGREFYKIDKVGCYRFIPSVASLRIESVGLNCDETWSRAIVVTGTEPDAYTWELNE